MFGFDYVVLFGVKFCGYCLEIGCLLLSNFKSVFGNLSCDFSFLCSEFFNFVVKFGWFEIFVSGSNFVCFFCL